MVFPFFIYYEKLDGGQNPSQERNLKELLANERLVNELVGCPYQMYRRLCAFAYAQIGFPD